MLVVVLAALSLGPLPAHASSNFNYDTAVTYSVRDDGKTVDVTENYTITNLTERYYLTDLKLSTPAKTVSNVRASYQDGGDIATSTSQQKGSRGDVSFDYQQISLQFPRQMYGLDKQWSFVVRYEATGLVDTRGGSHTVYVPSIEPADGTQSYKVTVDAPLSFGSPHFAGAKSASSGTRNGRQYFSFDRAELQKQSLSLKFGDSNNYKVDFAYPLHNTGGTTKTMEVTLPPNLNNQQVVISSLNPAPFNTRVDADGNIVAQYRVAPGQNLVVHTDAEVNVRWRDYDLSKSGKMSDIPADLKLRYTSSGQYWQTDGEVAKAAAKVTKPDAKVADNVQAIYKYVIDKLSYNDEKLKFNIRQGSAKALSDPTNAVCLEYADLMIGMLRSQGIPARMAVGYAYTGSLKASDAVDDSLHAWVEAYVPGIGWMTVDPTWGEKFDGFGSSDLDHLAFSIWGEDDSRPGAVMVDGADTNYQYEQAAISYPVTAVATAATGGKVATQRWQILPGLSIDRVEATAPGGRVVTRAAVAGGGQTVELGDLAPSQRITRWHWGGQASNARLSLVAGGGVLASGTAQVHTWPQWVVLALGAVLLIVVVLQIRKRRAHQRTASK